MSEPVEFKPIVSFTDGSQSFVNGFEAGIIWQQMQDGKSPIGGSGLPFRTDNLEVITRMAKALGYDVADVSPAGNPSDGWVYVTMEKAKPARFGVIEGGKP